MSDAASELMVPAKEADVARMAQIQALRMMSDTQNRTNAALDKVADKVDKIAVDLAGLRATDHAPEIAAIRAAFDAHVALVRQDNRDRDQRLTDLLAESLDDRKKLWLAIGEGKTADAEIKGSIKNLSDRIIPIFSGIAASVAVVVAIAIEKLFK